MPARIYLQLRQKGTGLEVPVHRFGPDGLRLADDGDTFPRRVLLKLRANNRITKRKLEAPGVSPALHPYVSRGRVALRADDLPSGSYRLKLFVEDLDVEAPGQGYRVDVGSSGSVEVELPVEDRELRRLVFPRGAGGLDPRMQDVVDASTIDGLPGRSWLTEPIRRPQRKACLLNVLAKLTAVPPKGGSLIRSVREVAYAESDRVYLRVDEDFHPKLMLQVADTPPGRSFLSEGRPKAPIHYAFPERLLHRRLDARQRKALGLSSFRERARPALQVITFRRGDVGTPDYAELDIDLGNPLLDVLGFVTHLGELAAPGRTDHFDMHRRLSRRKRVGPLLGYEIAEPA